MITFNDLKRKLYINSVYMQDHWGKTIEYWPVELVKKHLESLEKGEGILPGTRGAMVMSQRILRLMKRPEMKKLTHVIEQELLENAQTYYQRMGKPHKRKTAHRPGC